jgi:hypothetical protein
VRNRLLSGWRELTLLELTSLEVTSFEMERREVARREVARLEVARREVARREVARREVARREVVTPRSSPSLSPLGWLARVSVNGLREPANHCCHSASTTAPGRTNPTRCTPMRRQSLRTVTQQIFHFWNRIATRPIPIPPARQRLPAHPLDNSLGNSLDNSVE